MNKPLVSVIICVYNGAAFLDEAIQSVLKQTYPQVELIVVNDGSSDGSEEIARKYAEVKLLSHETNQGIPSARNTGIQSATGTYIAFHDADDRWAPEKLTKQVEFHRNHSQYRYSYTLERFFYEEQSEQPNWSKKKAFQEDHVAYYAGSMLIERSLFDEAGLFNPAFHNGETTEWLFRAKDLGYAGGIVHEVLLYRRIHNKNLSSNVNRGNKNLLQTVKSSINRQKKTGSG